MRLAVPESEKELTKKTDPTPYLLALWQSCPKNLTKWGTLGNHIPTKKKTNPHKITFPIHPHSIFRRGFSRSELRGKGASAGKRMNCDRSKLGAMAGWWDVGMRWDGMGQNDQPERIKLQSYHPTKTM